MNHMQLLASIISANSSLDVQQYIKLACRHFYGPHQTGTSSLIRVSKDILDMIQQDSDTGVNELGWFYSQLIIASQLGYADILRFSLFPPSNDTIYICNHLLIDAAVSGQASVVELLCTNIEDQKLFTYGFKDQPRNALDRSVLGGHLHIVSYSKEHGHRIVSLDITEAMSNAMKAKNHRVFQALVDIVVIGSPSCSIAPDDSLKGTGWSFEALGFAAEQDDLTSVMTLMRFRMSANISKSWTSESPLLIALNIEMSPDHVICTTQITI